MKKAPFPKNDAKRIEALNEYHVLDTPSEKNFDDITLLASQICDTKIALISLVDTDRQWFKSRHGLDAQETPRDVSFCGHAIMENEIFIINDAYADKRFCDNPLVLGEPKVRFYAGAPLKTPSGHRIGTLCVIDTDAKTLSEKQKETLSTLARHVIQLLELRRKNIALKEINDLSNNIQKLSKTGGWELDIETSKTTWTKQVYEIYQISEDTPTDKIQGILYYAEHEQDKLKKYINDCINDKKPFDDIFEFVDAKGNKKFVRSLGAPSVDSTGKVIKLLGSIQDVTEKINYQIELESAKNRLSKLINLVPAGIFETDPEGNCLYINDRWTELAGIDMTKAAGQGWANALHPDDKENVFLEWQSSVEENREFNLTYRFLKPNQEEVFVHGRSLAITNKDGETTGYLGAIQDITAQKKQELDLKIALHSAEKASNAKTDFLSSMSHEIRTPLNGIIGMTSLLQETKLHPEQEEFVEAISRSGASLLMIINDILDYSKIEAGKMELENIEFDINDFTKDLLYPFEVTAKKKGIYFKVEHSSSNYLVIGDSGRIGQIITNLVSNAIKFTSEGHVKVSINSQENKDKTKIMIQVTDTGIGISKDGRSKIFEAFAQQNPAIFRRFGGTGLGLSISKRLVDLLDGEINFESELGEGTTFSISLNLPKGKKKNKFSNSKTNENVFDHKIEGRILVAEDNPTNQLLISRILSKLNIKHHLVANGLEVIKELQENYYDLVLMDCQMPELDGYETTKIIRDNNEDLPNDIPIIALTANVINNEQQHCLDVGMNDYLSKPIELNLLIEKLDHFLGQDYLIDLKVFNNLRDDLGDDTVSEIIISYLKTSDKIVTEMQQALSEKNIKRINQLAHTLKSSSMSLGAMFLGAKAMELEQSEKIDNISDFCKLVESTQKQLQVLNKKNSA